MKKFILLFGLLVYGISNSLICMDSVQPEVSFDNSITLKNAISFSISTPSGFEDIKLPIRIRQSNPNANIEQPYVIEKTISYGESYTFKNNEGAFAYIDINHRSFIISQIINVNEDISLTVSMEEIDGIEEIDGNVYLIIQNELGGNEVLRKKYKKNL